MPSDPSGVDQDLLGEIAEEFAARLRAGENPSPSEYAARYPELAGGILELFPALAVMEQFKSNAPDLRGQDAPPAALTVPAVPVRRLGDYLVLREVGRGGMGVVYEAEQVSLGRHVALKVLPAHALTDERVVRRFRREAKAAAGLHHTNIVPVFGVGENEGVHYYVMQFIRGRGLDEVIRELRQPRRAAGPGGGPPDPARTAADVARALATGHFPRPPGADRDTGEGPAGVTAAGAVSTVRPVAGSTASLPASAVTGWGGGEATGPPPAAGPPVPSGIESFTETPRQYWSGVARVGLQVAQALQYAHTQGVLHRDIKPANLLLDLQGTVWVADFGLAKAIADADLTHSGDVVGTLRYMAPERFSGLSDARSDLYSLGLTLYELLTLRPAFDAADRNRLIQQVTGGEPPRPRRLTPGIPRDLETICLKCIEKQPARRYGSAEALAADLKNWLEGMPITARRVSAPERAVKWARRKPTLAALIVTVAAALGGGAVLGAWYNVRLRAALDDSRRAQDRAERSAYIADISLTRRDVGAGEVASAQAGLDRVSPQTPGDKDRRGFEWYYLRRLCSYELSRSWDAGAGVLCLSYSPDGRHLASGHGREGKAGFEPGPGDVQVRDAETGRVVRKFSAHRGPVFDLAYSRDGRLATAGADGTARVWDAETGALLHSLGGHRATVNGVAFSPDGRRVVTAGGFRYPPTGYGPPHEQPGEVMAWDAETGRRLWEESDRNGAVFDVAFNPDGDRVASGGMMSLSFRDPATGRVLASHSEGGGLSLSFRPDGLRLATSGAGQGVVYDMRSGQVVVRTSPSELQLFRFGWARSLAFHPPAGDHLAVTYGYEMAELPDVPRLQARRGVVRIWDSQRGVILYRLMAHRAPVHGLAFRPDGSELATADEEGKVHVWTTYNAKPPAAVFSFDRAVRAVAFAPDGGLLAAGGEDGAVRLVDPAGAPGVTLTGHSLGVLSLAFRPDGRHLASGAKDRTVRVWDLRAGRAVRVLQGHQGSVNCVAYAPDGRTLASAGGDGRVVLWDTSTGRRVRTLGGHTGAVQGVAFHPDGRYLATAGGDGLVKLWDPAPGKVLREWPGHRALVYGLAFDGDGRRLATAGADRAVNLWDPETGRLLLRLPLSTQEVYGVAFGGTGRPRLATFGRDQTVRLWDPETGQEVLGLTGHAGDILGAAFSNDGRRLATAGADRTVRLWDGRETPFVDREIVKDPVPNRPFIESPGR